MILAADEAWTGARVLTADVHVPKGVSLTLGPGCSVTGPFCLVVAGSLDAQGTRERPLLLPRLELEEAGRARLKDAAFLGLAGRALTGRGQARLAARRVAVEDCADGVGLFDDAAAELEDCLLRVAGTAAGQKGRGLLSLKRCRVVGGLNGIGADSGELEALGCALEGQRDYAVFLSADGRARLADCEVTGARRGAYLLGGRLEADGCRFKDQGDIALLTCAGSTARLRDCRIEGGRVAAAAKGAVELSGCVLQGQAETALDLHGAGHALEGVSVLDCPVGLSLDGRAQARELSLDCARTGVEVRPGGSLAWAGGSARGRAGTALFCAGSAELRDVRLHGSVQGLRLEGGRAEAVGCAIVEHGDCGLILLRGGEAALADTRVEGAARAVLLLGAKLSARDCALFSPGDACLDASGGAEAELERCRLEGAETGLRVFSGGARLLDCRLFGQRRAAAHLGQGGRARLERCGLEAAQRGLWLAGGSAELLDCRLAGQSQTAVLAEAGSRLDLERCSLEGAEVGLCLGASQAQLRGCRLAGQSRAAVLVEDGSRAKLSGCRVEGAPRGLTLSRSEAELSETEFTGAQGAVEVDEASRLAWRGGGAQGGAACALVSSGRAELRDVRLQDGTQGVRLEGGTLRGEGLALGPHRELGLSLMPGAFAALSRTRIKGAPAGIVSRGGHLHLLPEVEFAGCARDCDLDEASVVCSPWPPGPRVAEPKARRRGLMLFVLATKDVAPLRLAYRGVYALAARLFGLWARRQDAVLAAWAHRGWATADWEPGNSDLDLMLLAKDLSGPRGASWLRALRRRYRAWKLFFPFLGEPLVAEAADWDCVQRFDPGRAARSRLLLAGREPAPVAARGADAPDSVHAYTRLMNALFEPGAEPWPRARLQVFKAAIDLLRHGRPGDSDRVSRREFWEDLPRLGLSAWKEELRPLLAERAPALGERERLLARLGVESLRLLHDNAAPPRRDLVVCQSAAALSRRDDAFERRRLQKRVDFLRDCFEGLSGCVVDDLYRSYVVLDDDALACPGAAAGWLRLRGAAGQDGTLPLILTRRLRALWLGSPYLEDPAGALEPASQAGALLGAGRLLPEAFRLGWGDTGHAERPGGVSRGAALASLANLRMTWRLLAFPEARASGAQSLHYLLSRTLGLRLLLERGVAAPLFDLDAVLAAFRAEFPRDAAALDAFDARLPRRGAEETFFALYPFIDAQLRALAPAAPFTLERESRP